MEMVPNRGVLVVICGDNVSLLLGRLRSTLLTVGLAVGPQTLNIIAVALHTWQVLSHGQAAGLPLTSKGKLDGAL